MKNILKEKPSLNSLNSRMQYTLKYIQDKDVRDKTVLDIGCGFGWIELDLLKRGVKKVIGLEIAEEDLSAARENISHKKAQFMIGSGIHIPLKDNAVDTVVCFEVIEHIPKNTEYLLFSEVGRVLKKGGTFYLSTPFNYSVSKFLDPAWWLIGHRHYSEESLITFGRDNGFKSSSISVKGKLWSVISLLHMYSMKWIFRTKASPVSNFIEKKEIEEYKSNVGYVNIFIKYVLVKK